MRNHRDELVGVDVINFLSLEGKQLCEKSELGSMSHSLGASFEVLRGRGPRFLGICSAECGSVATVWEDCVTPP